MSDQKPKAYLVGGIRTPFGKFGGSMAQMTVLDMLEPIGIYLIQKYGILPDQIDQVVVANVIPNTPEALYVSRHWAMKLGLPNKTPALQLNRLCGSGLEAINHARRLIALGEAECILVGGVEQMSMSPHLIYGGRFGTKYGALQTRDFLLDTLKDHLYNITMGETTEILAEELAISRGESDNFSLYSHQKAIAAYNSNYLKEEILPLTVGKNVLEKDEHVRFDIDLPSLTKLRPTFRKEGVVTPASASGIVDGAACVLVTSEAFKKKHQLTGGSYILDTHVVGVDPKKMGMGPVPAISNLLEQNKLSKKDIDLFEINEAFAAQAMYCIKKLDLESSRVNMWGGATAFGHPLGATGVRLALTLSRQLKILSKKRGVASACIGGGQGIAMLLERDE